MAVLRFARPHWNLKALKIQPVENRMGVADSENQISSVLPGECNGKRFDWQTATPSYFTGKIMPEPLFVRNHPVLGPSPVWKGAVWWATGVGYCLTAWHVQQSEPLLGLGLMGLAPFVNLFCFFRGLNALRRGWLRWRTYRKASAMGLGAAWGSGLAGFLLVDEEQGVCIANGKTVLFADVEAVECRATHMAYKLFVYEKGQDRLRTRPFDVGFADETALLSAARRLMSGMERLGLPLPEAHMRDTEGKLTPLPLPAAV